eukprot:scaffold17061_cov93-Isochrysis_galbana.AAC.2
MGHSTILWRTSIASLSPPSLYLFPRRAPTYYLRCARLWGVAGVASAVFSIFVLSLGEAKNRPITFTDVQSDGRPLALPRDPYCVLRATCMRCGGCRVRFAMIDLFYNNGSTTT